MQYFFFFLLRRFATELTTNYEKVTLTPQFFKNWNVTFTKKAVVTWCSEILPIASHCLSRTRCFRSASMWNANAMFDFSKCTLPSNYCSRMLKGTRKLVSSHVLCSNIGRRLTTLINAMESLISLQYTYK